MKTFFTQPGPQSNRGARARSGFTLVEILVAVAIMSLLLAIILVPLRLGFETYHIGTARAGLQQEVQGTLQQINRDFRRANFVFPNTRVPGISDNSDTTSACSLAPYQGTTTGWNFLPYFQRSVAPTANENTDPADINSGIGITNNSNTVKAFANPNRIDMLFLRKTLNNGTTAQSGEDYVVTYYSRRLDITKAYDTIDNPIVLFRAQYPYRRLETSGFQPQPSFDPPKVATTRNPASSINAEVDWAKNPGVPLGSSSNNDETNRNYLWITHNYYGEANLEPLCFDVDTNTSPTANPQIAEDVIASHTLVTPRGMQLIAPRADADNKNAEPGAYMPELSFVESSTDGKRIDRVTVNMTLAQYDQAGAASVSGQGKAQRVPVSQTFELPNAGCTN